MSDIADWINDNEQIADLVDPEPFVDSVKSRTPVKMKVKVGNEPPGLTYATECTIYDPVPGTNATIEKVPPGLTYDKERWKEKTNAMLSNLEIIAMQEVELEQLRAENERLNKSAECLAESRRLAVKDLAALEGHMRLEIGQWRVDYDCAIRDVEHLRERIEAQAAEIEHLRAEAKAHYDRGYYDGYTYLLEQHEALREALQFYAETKNWAYVKSAGCNCVDADGGDTARAALKSRGLEIREKGQ